MGTQRNYMDYGFQECSPQVRESSLGTTEVPYTKDDKDLNQGNSLVVCWNRAI